MRRLPSSARRPSHEHIWKIKQDRPIVTTQHYYEVGITDSVAAFRSFADALSPSWGDVLVLNAKYVQIRLGIKPHLLSTEQTVITPQVLSTVVNTVRLSEYVVDNRRQLC